MHITPNGSIIMLPVLNIRHNYESSLELNQSSIIISSYPGRTRAFWEFGMDANGIMTRNYTTPQNWSIQQHEGRLEVNETGAMPIIIKGRHGFIIGGDANGFLWSHNGSIANYTHYGNFRLWNYGKINVTADWYNNTYPNQWNSSWATDLNITVHGERGFRAHCMLQNGALSCNANRSISPADINTNINTT